MLVDTALQRNKTCTNFNVILISKTQAYRKINCTGSRCVIYLWQVAFLLFMTLTKQN